MIPKTLSASAALVFEGCEARFNAEYIERTPDLTGTAAALGTSCHGTAERWVVEGHYLTGEEFSLMETIYGEEYYKEFSTPERYDEGLEMMKRWFDRQNWSGRKVLSTEKKETFDLYVNDPVTGQRVSVPFTYIWDRCDEWDDGTIEVIDYKTVIKPIQPEELVQRIQPRAYALAAMMKYPNAKRILVTYDLLRYDHVGRYFTRDECVATWRYLQQLLLRVLASDGKTETLNAECQYCVRKAACETLTKHAAGGGILGIDNPHDAADRRAALDGARKALGSIIESLDEMVMAYCEDNQTFEFETPNTTVKISAAGRRKAESERIAKIVGPTIMARYGSLGVGDVDKILKNEDLTDAQKAEIGSLIRKEFGKPYVKTSPKVFEDE